MKPNLFRGTIVGLFQGKDSGVALLGIEDDEKGRVLIPCDGNPACRAFNHAFPGTLRGGVFYNDGIAGERIYYTIESVGVLEGFTIETDASPELVAEYEKQRSKRRKGRVVDRGLLPPDDRIFTIGPVVNGRPILQPPKRAPHENN